MQTVFLIQFNEHFEAVFRPKNKANLAGSLLPQAADFSVNIQPVGRINAQISLRQIHTPPTGRKNAQPMRFGQLARRWLEAKRPRLRPRTYSRYCHIALSSLAALHPLALREITPLAVGEVFKRFINTPQTCKQNHLVLIDILRSDYAQNCTPKTLEIISSQQFLALFYDGSSCEHIKSLKSKDEVRNFYEKLINHKHSSEQMRLALGLLMHTALRSSNILNLRWDNVDLVNKRLIFDKSQMKNKLEFTLPLSKSALEILVRLKALKRPNSRHLRVINFSYSSLRRGFGATDLALTPHAVRSMFCTLANEHKSEHGCSVEAIERFLSHQRSSGVQAAYNHAGYFDELQKLANWWSALLGDFR